MTYLELINNFWTKTAAEPCTATETALYFYLVHLCNQSYWQNPMEVRTRDLELRLGVGRKYIGQARDGLQKRGFLKFSKGVGSGKSIYLLEGIPAHPGALLDVFVFLYETQLETQLETQTEFVFPYETQNEICVSIGNTIGNTNLPDTSYIDTNVSNKDNKDSKDIPAKRFQSEPKIWEEIKEFETFPNSYFEAVKREHNLTREEVLKILPKFADWCICDGKESHYGKQDLTSHFNKWLKYHYKKNYFNGKNNSEDRLSKRRGFVPPDEVRKGFKGTL